MLRMRAAALCARNVYSANNYDPSTLNTVIVSVPCTLGWGRSQKNPYHAQPDVAFELTTPKLVALRFTH